MEITPTTTPSLGSRIINVFTAPSEAFQGIDALPSKTSLWLIPFLLGIVAFVLVMFVISTDEVLKGQILDMQIRAIEQRVESGAMTQAQGDQAIQGIENMGSMFMIFGTIGGVFFLAVSYFGGALILWLTGKAAFKAPAGYSTYLGAYGLSSWIGLLGAVVTMLLMVGLGSMHASAGLALAIPDFDAMNTTHRMLARVELFAIWQAVVLGLGLSAITGKSAGTGIATAGVLWIIWVVASSMLGIGM
jgi:hypothetical protein